MSLVGIDEKGNKFPVPECANTLEGFLPKNWTPGEVICIFIMLFNSYLLFFVRSVSRFYFLFLFLFFRFAYNGFLGWLLDQQSKRRVRSTFFPLASTMRENGRY